MNTIPVRIEQCKGFWQCITPNTWVSSIGTLLGAFLGALVAGIITLYVMKKQLKIESKNKQAEELIRYLKIGMIAASDLRIIFKNSKEIYDIAKTKKVNEISGIDIKNIKNLYGNIPRCIENVQKINYDEIPYILNITYELVLEISTSIELDLKGLLKSIEEVNYESYTLHVHHLSEMITKLEENLETIIYFNEIAHEKL